MEIATNCWITKFAELIFVCWKMPLFAYAMNCVGWEGSFSKGKASTEWYRHVQSKQQFIFQAISL